ncbi:IS66 family insertion sequence element accessory protein TnpB [Burkholderia cenocepacia]|uniref:IS66 family insertion sequence element accessory protein TnpB n=1 Tax=Burkholderia cenocepacia TaxID=95486 RepID=UPI000F59ED74|nr:transposase [Burkholderia cenocepacia]RQV33870.1 transposase [Burkholderia cenocepacia]
MIAPPGGTRVWLAAGVTDMRRGMDGLATLVQSALGRDPFSGHIFLFRGRRGDLIKILWWSGDGMNLYAKRLERGRFVWPQADSGTVHLSAAQLSMLLEGIDWRGRVLGPCAAQVLRHIQTGQLTDCRRSTAPHRGAVCC